MKLTIKTPADLQRESEAQARAKAAQEARAYLASTDWMIVRQAETGKPVPDDVLAKRAAAREV